MHPVRIALLLLLGGCSQNLTGTPIVLDGSAPAEDTDTGSGSVPDPSDQDDTDDTAPADTDTGPTDSGPWDNGRDSGDTGGQ